jgi:uncharacterized protein YceH (UPF0502 family)
MSADSTLPSAPASITWPALDAVERRILGVLVEKAKTTPDGYPLSMNSLVTACNQKSNRDPLMNLSDAQVEETLQGVQRKGLVIKITGGRVERWRHGLYEAWHVDKVELAVLAELLLRGPQTEGELRGRASRMEPIDDLDALRPVLRLLSERRLVVYLTPEGTRGTVVTHGFHAPEELERLRSRHGADASQNDGRCSLESVPAARQPEISLPHPGLEVGLQAAHAEIAELRATVTALESKVASLTDQVREIRQGLGL